MLLRNKRIQHSSNIDLMHIKRLSWQDTIPVRHLVLWPDESPEYCKVEGDESALHFGISVQDKIVCVASLYINDDEARLRKFATLPEFQRQGIGSYMLHAIILELKKKRINYLWFDARESAIPFYERFGFSATGKRIYKKDVPYFKMHACLNEDVGPEIYPYANSFKDQIISLILEIQQKEFNISITEKDQPDLNHIEEFYIRSGGNFWVALVHNKVVGTISLLKINSKKFALRKMFVKKEYRGPQWAIAKRLLGYAESWAKEQGGQAIYLGTTEHFLAAHKFYRKSGYEKIAKNTLPESFPVMSVDKLFFRKSLDYLSGEKA